MINWMVTKLEESFIIKNVTTGFEYRAEFQNEEAVITITNAEGTILYTFLEHPEDAIGQVLDNAGFYA